jgi:hypothetical protein
MSKGFDELPKVYTCMMCGAQSDELNKLPHTDSCLYKKPVWETSPAPKSDPFAVGERVPEVPQIVNGTNLGDVLAARGAKYGEFVNHAEVTQNLKALISSGFYQYNEKVAQNLAPDQQEALDMICHKIGRIVCGDPDYADSWIDIAGYAKLVADRLEKEEKLRELSKNL